jgi:hypothetical protein
MKECWQLNSRPYIPPRGRGKRPARQESEIHRNSAADRPVGQTLYGRGGHQYVLRHALFGMFLP